MITTNQYILDDNGVFGTIHENIKNGKISIVFAFGTRENIEKGNYLAYIKNKFPDSNILTCSTVGQIYNDKLIDDKFVVTAVSFEKTTLSFHKTTITNSKESENIGFDLASKIETKNLKHVLVFTDGLKVNGTLLSEGINRALPKNVPATGGMVGDNTNFEKTLLGLNDDVNSGNIILIGLYGNNIEIGYGSVGGWDAFGPLRLVTKSDGNILYELDNKPALSLYKNYLGELASGLPSTALLFPLNIKLNKNGKTIDIVRTILAVDEKENSMTFAGDIPTGEYVQLMKANFDRIIEGAENAAKQSKLKLSDTKFQFALLVSCIGRKLVLKERTEEELESVKKILGDQASITGFYSYGEICPISPVETTCHLHNQTMTITAFIET